MRTPVTELWQGEPKIVIGIDVGTTQSAVAYTYLHPYGPQYPQRVTRWPGQESQKNETKIPSIIWYDSDGQPRAFGAEAAALEKDDDDGWNLVKFFKLHLHPGSIRSKFDIKVEPLPQGVSVEQVYAEFLGYLLHHTKEFFQAKTIDGEILWHRLRDSVEFVIAHPNGWGLNEQAVLQRACVKAGLVPSLTVAENRVHFVSEAEASVHFVMFDTNIKSDLQPGTEFLVCDVGGSTVDTTLYAVDSSEPRLQLREMRASACVQAGAIFIDQMAREYFRGIFQDTLGLEGEDLKEHLSDAVASFESETKKSFKDSKGEKSIKVGGYKFNNAKLGIKRGKMVLSGEHIEGFFEPCVSQILESINNQIDGHNPKYLLIVGGFGDSPYLRRRLDEELKSRHIQVVLSNDSTAKAVSDGTIIWFMKHNVIARATRHAFGTDCMYPTTQFEASLLGRKLCREMNGDFVDGYWSEIVPNGQVLLDTEERSVKFRATYNKPTLTSAQVFVTLYAFTGDFHTTPDWLEDADGRIAPGFQRVCDIRADISDLNGALIMCSGSRGVYWKLSYEIRVKFGSTSLRAYLVWRENDEECCGPAAIIPAAFY